MIAALSQEPTVFHPLMPGIEVDQGVWWQLFSPLWFIDPDGNFVPDLAREVPTIENGGLSADGLTWKIKLRSNVKWHDGTAFTADDVKFSLELINNTDFRARNRVGHNLVKDIKVVAPDEVHWRMEAPYSPYMSILSLTCMVPKHILEKVSDPNSSPFHNAPVGTGPFRWGERVAGDHILLHAHTGYHGKGPYLERVVFKYIPDLTVLYTQFRTGQVDYTGLQRHPAELRAGGENAAWPQDLRVVDGLGGACRAEPGFRPIHRPHGARGALSRDQQEGDHRRAQLRPADADRELRAATGLVVPAGPAAAQLRSGEGKCAARCGRMGSRRRRRPREGRRQARIHQFDDVRQCRRASRPSSC